MKLPEHNQYWNDETVERRKPYWVESLDDDRLLRYLTEGSNLKRCLEEGLAFADAQLKAVRGTVVELGAGVCWASAIVSLFPDVTRVHAIDFSVHPITVLAPLVLRQMHAATEKCDLHCGAMSPAHWPKEVGKVDLVLFCQALYMTEDPEALLREVYKALQPGGSILVLCENIEPHALSPIDRLKKLASRIRHGLPRHSGADISGRHPYRGQDYERFIANAGFTVVKQQLNYPVFKNGAVPAANYFGDKTGPG